MNSVSDFMSEFDSSDANDEVLIRGRRVKREPQGGMAIKVIQTVAEALCAGKDISKAEAG